MAIWCQNGGALKLSQYIEMTIFNGLLAKKQLNQTGALIFQVDKWIYQSISWRKKFSSKMEQYFERHGISMNWFL